MVNNKDRFIAIYRKMLKIRLFEEKIDWMFTRGLLGGTSHLCIGQEAVAVGVIDNLNQDDYVMSSHRGHGHLISKGGNIQKMFSELIGKIDGYCFGKGGTQHMCAKDIEFYGTNGITGGGIPIATGIALSIKLRKTEQVAVSFFGDGATNQGTFHESLNMASIWRLPIIYVCENNQYGMSTHVNHVTNVDHLAQRAHSYNIKSTMVDGMNILEVLEKSAEAINYVRSEKKPYFIEAKTYRHCGHSKSDPCKYRTKEEEKQWKEKDCIAFLRQHMISEGLSIDVLQGIEDEIGKEVEDALSVAGTREDTPGHYALEGVYADE